MKVRELIELLQKQDQDADIIVGDLNKDYMDKPIPYFLIAGPDPGFNYNPEKGLMGFANVTSEALAEGLSVEALLKGTPCVVLWVE